MIDCIICLKCFITGVFLKRTLKTTRIHFLIQLTHKFKPFVKLYKTNLIGLPNFIQITTPLSYNPNEIK